MESKVPIQEIVNSKCELSIWNPCPQSISWGSECEKEKKLVVEKDDKLLDIANDRLKMVQSKEYMPSYQNKEGEDKGDNNCTNWKQFTPSLIGDGEGQISQKEAYNIVPKFSSSNTNFRFCIILGGPPGSGKGSVLTPQLKKTASSINRRAAEKRWIELGHDQIVCNDEVFKNSLNESKLKPKDNMGPINIDDIKRAISSNSDNEWKQIINNQNKIYNERKGNIGDDKNAVRKKCIDIVKMMTLDKEIMTKCKDLIIRMNDNLLIITINQFINKDKPVLDDIKDDDEEFVRNVSNMDYITNAELLYIKTGLCFIFGFNITYESTLKSTSSMNYLFELANVLTDGCKSYNYMFLLGYSIVDYDTLLNRILNRYKKWADLPKERRQGLCSVGFPNLLGSKFKDELMKSYLTIASIIWFCIGPGNTCPGIGIDRILIYDNTGELPKKFSYTISTSDRSRKLVPVGLFNDPIIQTRTKRLLISVLMKNLNSINNSCPVGTVYTLPLADKIKVGDQTTMQEIHDIVREEDTVRSFKQSDYTVLQLKRDLEKVGDANLLNNINVVLAFQNLITTLNIKSTSDISTRYEQLKTVYGFDSILTFLKCIDENTTDKLSIEKTIDKIQDKCKKTHIVPIEERGEEKAPQIVAKKKLIEELNGGKKSTRKFRKRKTRRKTRRVL